MEKTHDDYGHELAKLREEGADWFERRDKAIRAANAAGMSLRTIANFMGMSQTGIQKIVKRDGQ